MADETAGKIEAPKLKVKKDGKQFYAVTKDKEAIVGGPFDTNPETKAFIKNFNPEETDQEAEGDLEAEAKLDEVMSGGDDEDDDEESRPLSLTGASAEVPPAPAEAEEVAADEVTKHNPHGLNIHERFARLLQTLDRRGIKHVETSNAKQNPSTTADKFARKPGDGQNALSPAERMGKAE